MKSTLIPRGGLRRHLLYRLILPVTAVALFALFLSIALAWGTFRRWSREEVMRDDHSRLIQAGATLAAFHNWLIPYMLNLRDDRFIVPLFNNEMPNLYSMVQGLNEMDRAHANGHSIHSLYVYNRPAGFYLSTHKGLQKPGEVDPEIDQLVRESATYRPYRYHPRTIGAPGRERDVLSIMVGDLPSTGNLPLQRGLIANIDLELLSRNFFADLDRRGAFRIIDSDGRELYRSGDDVVVGGLDGVFVKDGSVVTHVDGTPVAVSWHHNNDLGWWLVIESRLGYSAFSGDMRDIGIIGTILIILGVALAFTYRVAWGLYRPLESLFAHLATGGSQGKEIIEGSVFSEISKSVRLLGDRLDEDKVRRDRERIRDYLEGALSPRDAANLVNRIDEVLSSPAPWTVVAISMTGGVEYLIIGEGSDSPKALLEPYLGAGRTAGIGRPVLTASELPRSAREAREALAHRFRYGIGRLIPFSEIVGDPEEPYDLPIKSVRRLLETVNTGRVDRSTEILAEILDDLNDHRPEDFRMTVTFLAYELRRDLLPLTELDPGFAAVLDAHMEEVAGVETLKQASSAFRELLSAVKVRQENRSDDRSAIIADQAREILERDLSDPALCPDSIAGEIGLSTSYLRDIFKRVSGQSLSRVIQDRRLAECRTLLVETDLSVKEVSERAGYRNYNSFFSTFRRIVGLTPMEYREAHENRSDSAKN